MTNNNSEMLMQQVVYAISQAISVDAPRERAEHKLETNNRNRYLVGDLINENLRNQIASDSVELIAFSRSAWDGRIIADHNTLHTYTIIAQKTLDNATKRKRTVPYYLQAILVNQNKGMQGSPKQLTLEEFCPEISLADFNDEAYKYTYETMLGDNAEKLLSYTHYVIVYDMEAGEMKSIGLYLFDKDFATVEFKNLSEFISPDFATLTGYVSDGGKDEKSQAGTSRSAGLLKLKPQIKERKKA